MEDKEKREKLVKDAFAIASLESRVLPENDLQLFKEYIEGTKELSEILQEAINKYRISL